jgi:hypothetical protein
MAPVDFEKELQDRLRSREVQPRTDSWHRIEARLEAETPARKAGTGRWKYFVAASVVFLLGYFFLQESAVDVPGGVVVESPEPIAPEIRSIPEPLRDSGIPASDSQEAVVVTEKFEPVSQDGKTRNDQAVREVENRNLVRPDLADRSLAVLTPEVQDDLEISVGPGVAVDTNRAEGLEDAEVDALLSEALQVVENKGIPRDTTSLNPSALLGEVESELDQTFREQILKKLKTGFSKVRTAVADRSQ